MVWTGQRQAEGVLTCHALGGKRTAGVSVDTCILAAAVHDLDEHDALGERGRRVDGLCQTALAALLDLDTVDDDLDRVLDLLVELELVGQRGDLAVDAHAAEALLDQVLEEGGELTLAALDDGRHDHDALARGDRHDLIHDLVDGLLLDDLAAGGAMRRAYARVEQSQVVVDLRHCCDGGAGVLVGRLLVDGDGRGEAVDTVEVWLLHLAEELPCVAREALDVAALALRVDGVERKRALAATGQAGEDDELVARNLEVDVVEVVLARTFDDDVLGSQTLLLRDVVNLAVAIIPPIVANRCSKFKQRLGTSQQTVAWSGRRVLETCRSAARPSGSCAPLRATMRETVARAHLGDPGRLPSEAQELVFGRLDMAAIVRASVDALPEGGEGAWDALAQLSLKSSCA